MKCLTVTLGMTAAGKTTWLRDKSPVVETDDLRVELFNDVDDISQEKLIFDTAVKRVSQLFELTDTVYFGATLVDSKYRIPFLQSVKDICKHELVIDMFIFPCTPAVSMERITKDLKDGVQRADSIKYIDEQYEQYLDALISLQGDEKDFYRTITTYGK